MQLYHGSTNQVKNPNVDKGRNSTDFGKGFYTTTNFEQAKTWALSKQKTAKNDAIAIVSIYEVDDNLLAKSPFKVRMFDSPDRDWLSFVVGCRRGVEHDYDMIFGAVADDKIYTTITLYESNVLTAEETVARLKINEYYNQISFHSGKAVSELRFVSSIVVTKDTTVEDVNRK